MPVNTDPCTGVASPPHPTGEPTGEDLRDLAEFRASLRKFLFVSELRAEEAGLTSQRFQALLAIWTHRDQQGSDISVGELSDLLLIKGHSAAELVARLASSGLIDKVSDSADKRKTLIRLTPEGERRMLELAAIHLSELKQHQAAWGQLLHSLQERD